jgi:hypothetical protein
MKCDYRECPQPKEETHETIVGLVFHTSCFISYWGIDN